MAITKSVFDELVLFSIKSRVPKGHRTVTTEKLKLIGAKPPKKLYSEGGFNTIHSDLFNPFDTCKKAAIRYMEESLLLVGDSYGTSEAKAEAVGKRLDAFEAEFQKLAVDLRPQFQKLQQDHLDANPGWESVIKELAPSEQEFFDGMHFSWSAKVIGAPKSPSLQKGFQATAGNLFTTLCTEVASTAQKVFESLTGKEKLKAGNTVIERLSTLVGKLEGISFIDPRVQPLGQLVKEAIAGIPLGIALSQEKIMHLLGLCSLLKDEASLVQYGEGLLSGQMTTSGIIGAFAKPGVVTVTPVTVVANAVIPVQTSIAAEILAEEEQQFVPPFVPQPAVQGSTPSLMF
jgi:hypothetical protein